MQVTGLAHDDDDDDEEDDEDVEDLSELLRDATATTSSAMGKVDELRLQGPVAAADSHDESASLLHLPGRTSSFRSEGSSAQSRTLDPDAAVAAVAGAGLA